jgi:HEAT repeat protein
MIKSGRDLLALSLIVALALPALACGEAQDGSKAQRSAGDALARLAAIWKEPGDSSGAGLSDDNDPVWKVRMESLVTVARAGRGAIPVLVDALRNGPPVSRILAAQALGLFAEPGTRPALKAALKDSQSQVRLYAIRALRLLGRLGPPEEYRTMMESEGNWIVQVEIASALQREDKADPASLLKQIASYDLKRLDSVRLDVEAPDFTLISSLGVEFRLSRFRGRRAVLLVFRIRDT